VDGRRASGGDRRRAELLWFAGLLGFFEEEDEDGERRKWSHGKEREERGNGRERERREKGDGTTFFHFLFFFFNPHTWPTMTSWMMSPSTISHNLFQWVQFHFPPGSKFLYT